MDEITIANKYLAGVFGKKTKRDDFCIECHSMTQQCNEHNPDFRLGLSELEQRLAIFSLAAEILLNANYLIQAFDSYLEGR